MVLDVRSKVGNQKIMCICGTYVIGLRLNLSEIDLNSNMRKFNE
jgi:hypothetical protein